MKKKLSNSKMKTLFALIMALIMLFQSSSIFAVSYINTPEAYGTINAYTMDIFALKEDMGTNLYITITPIDKSHIVPASIKQVQIKVFNQDGTSNGTIVKTQVSTQNGTAVLSLGDIPLLSTVEVHALVSTMDSVNTEVLSALTTVSEFYVNGSKIVTSKFEGFGTQYNHNLYAEVSQIDGITPENVSNLENKVINLGSQHVRIFYDPDNKFADGVTIDPNRVSFIKTVELAQNTGATVNITYWHGPFSSEDIDSKMQAFADSLYDLLVNRKLTSVQYVTIQNEVNTTAITMDTYQQLYRVLDSKLKEYGIRSRIKFIGGDLVKGTPGTKSDQELWFKYMAANMNDILDGYSVHIYWTYTDRNYGLDRLTGIKEITDSLPIEAQKPLYITEFGARGLRNSSKYPQPGTIDGTLEGTPFSDTNINAFQHAWFTFEALNKGFAALVKWDAYKAKYDKATQYYGAIGSGNDGYPLKPVYYQNWLLTHTAKPGWKVSYVDGKADGKLVAAMTGLTNEQTVYALNDSEGNQSFIIGGLTPEFEYRFLVWNYDGSGIVSDQGTVIADINGVVSVTIPEMSFAAITTVK